MRTVMVGFSSKSWKNHGVEWEKMILHRTLICGMALLFLGACDGKWGRDEVPFQPYSNALTALFSDTGDLSGRILFPSEYSQHSIRFFLGKFTFVTNPDGRFRISRIPAGILRFTVNMHGYEPIQQAVTISGGSMTRLKQMALIQARGLVFGRLINQSGSIAEGIRVQLAPLGGVSLSDNHGVFRFDGVKAGNHLLRIDDSRFSPKVKRFVMEANQHLNLGVITVIRLPGSDRRTAKLDP